MEIANAIHQFIAWFKGYTPSEQMWILIMALVFGCAVAAFSQRKDRSRGPFSNHKY